MSVTQALDDLKVGQFFLITKGAIASASGSTVFRGPIDEHEETHWNGLLLEIIAIDMPFIAGKFCDSGGIVNFDMRRGWMFKVLSRKYGNALLKEIERERKIKETS